MLLNLLFVIVYNMHSYSSLLQWILTLLIWWVVAPEFPITFISLLFTILLIMWKKKLYHLVKKSQYIFLCPLSKVRYSFYDVSQKYGLMEFKVLLNFKFDIWWYPFVITLVRLSFTLIQSRKSFLTCYNRLSMKHNI